MNLPRRIQTNLTGGIYSHAVSTRVDLEAHSKGVATGKNTFVQTEGGMSNRPGFELVSMTREGGISVQVPFLADTETDETYILLFSDSKIMFTRNGAPLQEAEVTGITEADNAGAARFTKVAHGFAEDDYVVYYDTNNVTMHGRMFKVDYIDADTFELIDIPSGSYVPHSYITSATFTMRRRYTVTTPYIEDQLRRVSYAQDNDIMYLANGENPFAKISRNDELDWTYEAVDFTPATPAPTNINVSGVTGTGHDPALETTYYYKVAAISEDTLEESLPSSTVSIDNDLAIQGAHNTVTWDAVAGAKKYVLYKKTQGAYGYVGSTEDLSYKDTNTVEDLQDGPQEDVNPFETSDEYPRSVTLHEQRAACGSLKADPQVVNISKSTLLENFGTASPAKADDAITFRVKDRSRQHIYSMVSVPEGLALFTSTSEWIVRGGNEEGYLTPTNPLPRKQTKYGSYWLPPLEVGGKLFFAQARGGVIRDFEYKLETNKFNGTDYTVMCKPLFEHSRVVSWAYAMAPHSIVYAVMDTGVMYSMTYQEEHNIRGWTEVETDGFVEDVETVPEGDIDAVYITVKRNIDGTDVRFHERMREREDETDMIDDWFYVDCGLQYNGAATETVNGLWHLEGKEVAILADGNALANQTVANGAVQLGAEYSNVIVGIPYEAEIQTLDIDLGNIPDLGTVVGRTISIPTAVIAVEKSRGVFVGRYTDKMVEVKERDTENYGTPIDAYTGTHEVEIPTDTEKDAHIIVRQTYPLPLTVNTIGFDIVVGG